MAGLQLAGFGLNMSEPFLQAWATPVPCFEQRLSKAWKRNPLVAPDLVTSSKACGAHFVLADSLRHLAEAGGERQQGEAGRSGRQGRW